MQVSVWLIAVGSAGLLLSQLPHVAATRSMIFEHRSCDDVEPSLTVGVSEEATVAAIGDFLCSGPQGRPLGDCHRPKSSVVLEGQPREKRRVRSKPAGYEVRKESYALRLACFPLRKKP